jgi:hypothetical protein
MTASQAHQNRLVVVILVMSQKQTSHIGVPTGFPQDLEAVTSSKRFKLGRFSGYEILRPFNFENLRVNP